MNLQAIAFDAYGTLFDVYSIRTLAERLFPSRGAELADLWRSKQIEYAQLRTLCSMYRPFWEVTQDALVFACKKLGVELTLEAQTQLMGQYAKLEAFPENLEVLSQLQALGMKLAILSNGNPQMLEAAVAAVGMQGLFSQLLSVDAVRKFKTAPEAYQLGPDVFGVSPKNILFVSSNGWDICGASWFGYRTYWINRTNGPFEELGVVPDGTGPDMWALLEYVQKNRTQG
ncbi:haloacid dehalogenase type II [Noviherbaspirillum massiliense]|uniref:haloacid dehalogenase type II n=1 Tax=Noviherbaspirillum massiliense TaxID=1465823 RepID=UPI0003101DE4|nr:haloacid dehalogenase type II [Noviherbaspirillum massiliense]